MLGMDMIMLVSIPVIGLLVLYGAMKIGKMAEGLAEKDIELKKAEAANDDSKRTGRIFSRVDAATDDALIDGLSGKDRV